MNKTDYRKKRWITITVGLLFIFVIIVVIIIIFNGRVEQTSVKINNSPTTGLFCKGSAVENPFFSQNDALSATHEIKVLLYDGEINTINYTRTGVYNTHDEAEEASSSLHANYNIYMSGNSIDQEALQPTFSVIDNKSIVNLSVNDKTLIPETARIVFLSVEQYANRKNYSLNEIKDIYEKKGFVCKSTE